MKKNTCTPPPTTAAIGRRKKMLEHWVWIVIIMIAFFITIELLNIRSDKKERERIDRIVRDIDNRIEKIRRDK